MTQEMPWRHLFKTLPVSLFGSVMSLTALSFAWKLEASLWDGFHWVSAFFAALALAVFVLLFIGYLRKVILYPQEVMAEISNPVKVTFLGTAPISILLIPGILLPFSQSIAIVTWSIGVVGIFVFSWYMLRRWMDRHQNPGDTIAPWFLPIVGTLDVPIVGLNLPFEATKEICLFFFSIGIGFTIILFPLLFARLFYQKPMPDDLQPSLLILIGPLALAFTDYIGFAGTVDRIASIFFYLNLFILLVLISKLYKLPFRRPFRLTWWAVCFPLAAFSIASLHFSLHKRFILLDGIAWTLVTGTSLIVLYLLWNTIRHALKGEWESH